MLFFVRAVQLKALDKKANKVEKIKNKKDGAHALIQCCRIHSKHWPGHTLMLHEVHLIPRDASHACTVRCRVSTRALAGMYERRYGR